MIPQRNLSLLSNRLFREGGRRIPEAILERDYCLAWFLIGLSRSNLKGQLAFKGGTALKRCYFGDYRFSEDLDFTLIDSNFSFSSIRQELEPLFTEVLRSNGVKIGFDHEDQQSHQNSYTFYLNYEGPLLPTIRPKMIKVDITIREEIVFKLESRMVLRAYDEYEDLPEDTAIFAYSLSEIATEKVVALFDSARNEPRDLYDIWYLTSNAHVDLADLLSPIEKKWAFRKRKPADNRAALETKESRYEKLWEKRLAAQMIELPEFADVFRIVRKAFREAKII